MATIDALPQAGQTVRHEGKEYTTIKEGLAHILVPQGTPTSTDPKMSKEETQRQQVFYNPIQQFNRDLSVLAIKTFGEDLVERKRERHQQSQKRNRNKRKPKQEQEQEQEAAAETSELASRKRKLDEDSAAGEQADIADSADQPCKKTKTTESGEVELAVEPGTDAANATESRPPWRPEFKILDALSATGLRALRYAKEIPFATAVTANDMSHSATETIALNVQHNKLKDTIHANTGNAIAYMYGFMDGKGFDVIDLDPYGSAAPFIDAAVQAINHDGLLCVTCTDSAIFASHGYLEKTYSQYGGLPLKGEPCHEGGIRLILHAIASSAGRYGMAIEPLLSLSIDYYIRVFVRVRKAPLDVKMLAGKTMVVYHCDGGCGSWTTQFLARNKEQANKKGEVFYKHSFAQGPTANENCEHCGFKTHLSGPMYGGPIHNVGFIERVLAQLNAADKETYPTMDRIQGMLHTAREEITFGIKEETDKTKELGPLIPKADPAKVDHHPFFFIPSSLARVLHCSAPSTAALRGALRHAGFRVSMSHCKPGSLKTDASWRDIWHIMREWVRQKSPLKKPLKKEVAGYDILFKDAQPSQAAQDIVDTDTSKDGPKEQPKDESQSNGEPKPEEPSPSYKGVDFEVKFDEELGRDHDRGKYVRYQLAPRENWGPMSRAK